MGLSTKPKPVGAAVTEADQALRQLDVRVGGPRSSETDTTVRFELRGGGSVVERQCNGDLTHVRGSGTGGDADDLAIGLDEAVLRSALLRAPTPEELDGRCDAEATGYLGRLSERLVRFAEPDAGFTVKSS
ncbi:hypothetical protein [Streptomyces pratensis]|uniref:hypothetical protein n=1 Tax=Streptomyces pratensis TaxID=1169025 RepID=UPI003634B8C3